jgi:hypothetical protein
MGSLNKIVLDKLMLLLASFIGIVVIYVVARFTACYKMGYKWTEMDWNQDGHTSLSEVWESTEVRKRTVQYNGEDCIEYIYIGKPTKLLKVTCNHSSIKVKPGSEGSGNN